jgi:hypothetical protein
MVVLCEEEQHLEWCSFVHRDPCLKLTEARLLRDILDRNVNEGRLSNPEQVALNRLRNAGLVTEAVEPDLSADVKASLLLENNE